MELMLGTVQFGLDYGVSNAAGQVTGDEVARILDLAAREGVRRLDTARAYGESEGVLGRALSPGHAFRVVTKLPPGTTADAARAHLEASLAALGVEAVDGLLVHATADWTDALAAALAALREEGRVARIGASVYDPSDAAVLSERYDLDLVQLPLNLFDQRALRDGVLEILAAQSVAVHVRSVFLQGLLLMDDAPFPEAAAPLRALQALATERGVDRVSLALSFARALPVEAVLVGVTSAQELEEILSAWRGAPVSPSDFASLAQTDLSLLDPSRWVNA